MLSSSSSSDEERLKVTDLAGGGWEVERGGCGAEEDEEGRAAEGEWARGVFRPRERWTSG